MRSIGLSHAHEVLSGGYSSPDSPSADRPWSSSDLGEPANHRRRTSAGPRGRFTAAESGRRRHPFEVMPAGAWRRTVDAVTKTALLPDIAAVDAGRMRGRRRALVWTLIVLATLIALGSILTTWVHRQ